MHLENSNIWRIVSPVSLVLVIADLNGVFILFSRSLSGARGDWESLDQSCYVGVLLGYMELVCFKVSGFKVSR